MNTGTLQDSSKEFLAISACLVLTIASFSPWMSIQTSSMLGQGNLTVSTEANHLGLALTSCLALALVLCKRRWSVMIPSVYALRAVVQILFGWTVTALSDPPPAGNIPQLFTVKSATPSFDLLFVMLGATLGIVATWSDCRAALASFREGRQARSSW